MPAAARIVVVALPVVLACTGDSGDEASVLPDPPAPSAACETAWQDPAVVEFVDLLERATQPGTSIWGEYDLGDASYVVIAGESSDATICAGAWHAGQPLGFADLPDAPKLLTPLYGYHLAEQGNGGPFDDLVPAAEQPPSVQMWLDALDVSSAVVMPVIVEDFPIEIPTLMKVQLAIHEGFHVTVQAPEWMGAGGEWPGWDLQPDRPGVQACYTGSPEVETARAAERESLDRLIAALLDGDRPAACTAGEEFLTRRDERYALLESVSVARHDGTAGTCSEAEAVMEAEEGTADYASWVALFDLGLANRDQLMARYRAQQNDWFYLSGAMQLHAVHLLAPERMLDVTREIAMSTAPEEGSPTAVLSRTLDEICR